MSDSQVLRRLRTLLRALAAAIFAGTVVELLLAGHTDGWVQWIPFAICAAALVAHCVAWRRPRPGAFIALRIVMAVAMAGSVLGAYEHLEGNYGFARETRPDASVRSLLPRSVAGRDPLLAPGILSLGAVLSLAATYGVGVRRPEAAAQPNKQPAPVTR